MGRHGLQVVAGNPAEKIDLIAPTQASPSVLHVADSLAHPNSSLVRFIPQLTTLQSAMDPFLAAIKFTV